MRTRSVLLLLLAAPPTWARTVPVQDTASLQAAIAAALAGDEILLADGTYPSGNISCSAAGTESAPIVVRAANPLGASIRFSGVEGFKVSGPQWHFIDLDIQGTCAVDDDCEHAFHVTGAADGFIMRGNRVRDFNAQLKVNAAQVNGAWRTPNNGVIEYNDLGDTRGRVTANPVTKLNIDTGDDWIIRGNVLHDFFKDGGNGISYGAFMKSGGHRGLFERNLVLCARDVPTGGVRIGLSFGGGGTAPQYCAPAFDAATPCSVEHHDGTARNNILANCSDVGIYVNRGANTSVLHNTLIATSGVDFRFDTTTGRAVGNLMGGALRARDGAVFTDTGNVTGVTQATFDAAYRLPHQGDLALAGSVAAWVGAGNALADVPDDYCARTRPSGTVTVGALEHALGSCATVPPPRSAGAAPASSGAGSSAAPASSAGTSASSAAPASAPAALAPPPAGASGCLCGTPAPGPPAALVLPGLLAWMRRRRAAATLLN
ncbi:MAG: PE-PGRS family protein [Deltaproteobacteria bacterium]|nr:PE-PGRS family protein [Deltaproteobacteria bacterium]